MRNAAALVLLIEDCEQTRGAYAHLLIEAGYRVAVAVDGQDGLAKAQQLQPDIIITDLDMPVLSGLELAALVREHERTRLTPIIVLTASGMRRCMWRAYEVGCDQFLLKPCRSRQLIDAIEHCLRGTRDQDKCQPLKRTG